jgi:hypothetical protein
MRRRVAEQQSSRAREEATVRETSGMGRVECNDGVIGSSDHDSIQSPDSSLDFLPI